MPPPAEPRKRPQDGISRVQKVAAVENSFRSSPECFGGIRVYIGGRSRSGGQRGAHKVGGRALPPGRALHPRGPPVAPLMYFFLLYIPTYPKTTRYGAKNLIPPPQPSVPMRSHLGAFSGVLSEGESIMQDFYINTITSLMKYE